MEPIVKKVRAMKTDNFRPIEAIDAKTGWKTAEQRTNEVPVQYIAVTLALRSCATVFSVRSAVELEDKEVFYLPVRQQREWWSLWQPSSL
jgi:hypothetical protein